jgi:RNA polymerase sigma-70 factor, ECF subfamily
LSDLPVELVATSHREPNRPDSSLLEQLRSGDHVAAKALFDRYASRLNALAEQYCTGTYARRFEAEDVVQSVFRIFFQGVKTNAYDVPSNGELWGLLMVITMNKIREKVHFHRAAKRDVSRTTPLSIGMSPERQLHDGNNEANMKIDLEEIIEMLPVAHRSIVIMRMQGYEVQEISDRLVCSRRSVERILQDLRQRFRSSEVL